MYSYNNDAEEKKKEEKSASSMLQEKLIKSRTIVISGEINQELAAKVCTQLLV